MDDHGNLYDGMSESAIIVWLLSIPVFLPGVKRKIGYFYPLYYRVHWW